MIDSFVSANYKQDQVFFKELEEPWKPKLPSKSFYIIRVDGRAFHSWTKELERPFDHRLRDALVNSAMELVRQIDGAICCYVYSDEISVIFTDTLSEYSQIWFGGVVTKISSISSSIVTAVFNSHFEKRDLAFFDARVFSLNDQADVCRYLAFRARDCFRNAVSSVCINVFSHKELHKKSITQRIEMLTDKSISLEDINRQDLYGTFIAQVPVHDRVAYKSKATGQLKEVNFTRNTWTPSVTAHPQNAFSRRLDQLMTKAVS